MPNDPAPRAKDLSLDDIEIGQEAQFERLIASNDIRRFAELTGDHNPLHVDEAFGQAGPFGRNVAHGLLVGSLMSTIVGMHCPGRRSLYLSQSFNFRQPVFAGDTVHVKATVTAKSQSARMITLKTEIRVLDKLVIDGECRVKVL
jgi:3-hydroxybutyryl-CoA dehydratase